MLFEKRIDTSAKSTDSCQSAQSSHDDLGQNCLLLVIFYTSENHPYLRFGRLLHKMQFYESIIIRTMFHIIHHEDTNNFHLSGHGSSTLISILILNTWLKHTYIDTHIKHMTQTRLYRYMY